MKKLLFTFIFLATSITMMGQVPAFPGAEGHGRYVTGGRGGVIRHVTTLLDDGKASTQGTLRWAVSGNTKKIVVFDVAGVIALQSDLSIGANTTIAGQTAPYPGITLRYYTVRPNGDNIIIRFLRMRRGQEKDVNDGADASWCKEHKDIILDHCSFSWSIDEVASFYDNNNFTMQWCTLGESLNNAGHGKGAHGYGGIWGGKLASFHHNMICHVNNRSPRFNGARYNWTGYTGNDRYEEFYWDNAIQAENVDFRNCVIYNCGNGCYGGPGGGQINMVNNYYKSGPAGSTSYITTASVANSTTSSDNKEFWTILSRYYIVGNMIDGKSKNWDAVTYDKNATYTINGKHHTPDPNHFYGDVTYSKNTAGTDCVQMELTSPTDYGTVTTHNAQTAFNKVLDYAGASLHRDDVDARYMKEAKNGTATYSGSVTGKPGRIDLVSDVNGYTEENFGTGSRPDGFDTDQDGMPDEWELLNGLNPNDKNDGKTITLDTEKGWYTNLEVYLSSLVEDIMQGGNSDAQSGVDEYYPACVKMPEPTPPTPPTPTTNCSILWKFDTGAEGQQATLDGLAQKGIKSATVTLGSELKYNGKLTAGGLAETKIQQKNPEAASATDANTIIFSITPAKGYSLKTTSVMFTATRVGTDRGKIDAKWVDDNGTSIICSGVTPNRNNQSPYYSTYSTDLDGDATTGECKLIINLYELSFIDSNTGEPSYKDVGFCNITIEGVMTAPEIIKGDVNGDGKVDMSDVTDLVQYILGNPSEDFNTDAADVNGDGEIGMPDVMFIIQYTINGKFPTE